MKTICKMSYKIDKKEYTYYINLAEVVSIHSEEITENMCLCSIRFRNSGLDTYELPTELFNYLEENFVRLNGGDGV